MGLLWRLQTNQPACTVGSLKERVTIEALHQVIENIVLADNPKAQLAEFAAKIEELFPLRQSAKHMRANLEEDIMRVT